MHNYKMFRIRHIRHIRQIAHIAQKSRINPRITNRKFSTNQNQNQNQNQSNTAGLIVPYFAITSLSTTIYGVLNDNSIFISIVGGIVAPFVMPFAVPYTMLGCFISIFHD
jgi:hypothetical protein